MVLVAGVTATFENIYGLDTGMIPTKINCVSSSGVLRVFSMSPVALWRLFFLSPTQKPSSASEQPTPI